MSKVAFTKLGLKPNTEVVSIHFNDLEIEVKQYLPIQEKLELIGDVINGVLATDDNKFPNFLKMDMFLNLEIVFKYTNISFTEKQKEDLPKLYDLLAGAGLIEKIVDTIPKGEYHILYSTSVDSLEGIHQYKNSAYGILDAISTDYENLNLDIDTLTSKLSNAENLDLVKDVVTKLG